MKIGIILEQLKSIGGTSIHVSSMAKCLADEGHEVHVISLGEVNKCLDLGNVVHHSAGPLPANILDGNSSARLLINMLLEVTYKYEIDIVHAHYPCAMLASAINKVINDVPYVVTLHGYEIQSFLMRDFQYYSSLVGLTLPSTIISVSKALASEFTEIFEGTHISINDASIEIIPDGTSFEIVTKEAEEIRKKLKLESEFTFVFVGRLSVEKGLRELLLAFKETVKQQPNCRLIIVGRGQMSQEIDEFISQHDLKENVHLIGEIPHYEVIKYLSASDVLVLPSHSEGLGTVILEAFAAGIPIIGTTVGGIPEAIMHNENGLLVRPRDHVTLADEMIKIATDPEGYDHLKQGAINSTNKYTWNNLTKQIIEIYKNAIYKRDKRKEEMLNKIREKYDFSQGNPWDKSSREETKL
ncbi:glycosyltransferase family 4 protein [Paenibacillus medicaginis]|uniref:Glycosyltransferase family 4 protein n=1 Tax=Paenibacillus medicaginis TaxID=1470560 RepID=A0ABV5BVE5_9BACL